jgi:lipopolysaccharide export LptBFGC system permease protein LptF
MRLLDRYLIGEAVKTLLIGALCVLGIFFCTAEFQNVMELLNRFGLPLERILSIMMLQLPTGLAYCMPAGVLLAVLVCTQRLQRDSEILALQVSGISLKRIIFPYLLMGSLATVASYACAEYIAPQSKMLSEKMMLLGILHAERPFVGCSKIEIKDKSDKVKQLMLLGNTCGRTINCFTLIDRSADSHTKVVWAKKALWNDGNWELQSGRAIDLSTSEKVGDLGQFEKMTLGGNGKLIEDIKAGAITTMEKTTAQLLENIALYENNNEKPPPYLLLQYYRRFAHPLSCLLLVVAAAPLMVPRSRRGNNLAYCYGGVTIVSFFLLQQICLSLSVNQRIDPLIGAWFPCILLASIGLALLLFRRKFT